MIHQYPATGQQSLPPTITDANLPADTDQNKNSGTGEPKGRHFAISFSVASDGRTDSLHFDLFAPRLGDVGDASVNESADAFEKLKSCGVEMSAGRFGRAKPPQQFGQQWHRPLADAGRGGALRFLR